MDRRERALRVAEPVEQRVHALEAEAVRRPGTSVSSQSVADRIELAAVALELLALGVDDLGRRVLDEALVREQPLGALDLLAQPVALGLAWPFAFGARPA